MAEKYWLEEEQKEEINYQHRSQSCDLFFSFLLQNGEKMKNIDSLKNSREFGAVYRNGNSKANKYLVMYMLPNDYKKIRIGISVSKKVGNSIVRHRLARLIRESYRLHRDELTVGYDIVVVARNSAKDKNYQQIESAFMHLVHLHHLNIC